MLKPLSVLSAEAQRITPQTLDGRLKAEGVPSELQPLVQAFNSALDRLQQGFRTQQEFLANAAHELKTPLALIRAQVEMSGLQQQQPHLIQDVDRMARQVQQLLLLAEASEVCNYRVEQLDPYAVFEEACQYLRRVADAAGVQVSLLKDENLSQWHADRGALFTLLKNLLENAIQHSPRNTVVAVNLRATGFTVEDNGPGVTADQLQMLFIRFWRGANRRDEGAGLGLSICQEIVTAHGWRIEAKHGKKGLKVSVFLDA
jgi:signal transduction histidine kinase